MSEIRINIISNTEDEIEFEITQPNDYAPDEARKWWSEEDHKKWEEKMNRLEQEGTRGQIETIRTKLKKNPFIDGSQYLQGEGQDGITGDKNED